MNSPAQKENLSFWEEFKKYNHLFFISLSLFIWNFVSTLLNKHLGLRFRLNGELDLSPLFDLVTAGLLLLFFSALIYTALRRSFGFISLFLAPWIIMIFIAIFSLLKAASRINTNGLIMIFFVLLLPIVIAAAVVALSMAKNDLVTGILAPFVALAAQILVSFFAVCVISPEAALKTFAISKVIPPAQLIGTAMIYPAIYLIYRGK